MNLPTELTAQVDAYLHNELSPAEIDELGAWLQDNPDHARRFAREVLHFTELRSACLARGDAECLDEAAAPTIDSGDGSDGSLWSHLANFMPPIGGSTTASFWTLILLVALFASGGIVLLLSAGSGARENRAIPDHADPAHIVKSDRGAGVKPENVVPPAAPKAVARLSRLWKPQWTDSAEPFAEWSPLSAGQIIDLAAGRAEVFFDVGAHLTLQGPVRFEVLGPKSGRVFHGDLTARVGEHAKGFYLISAMGKVIDLGTEFGMSVQADGELDVVVFDGTVDLQQTPPGGGLEQATSDSTDATAMKSRLTTGEAVRIKPDGSAARIVAIDSDRFPKVAMASEYGSDRTPVIKSVSDNIRTPGAGPFYEIVHAGFGEDARAYVDRPHEWNGVDESGIPEFLRGADYVKAFNDDKVRGQLTLTVELVQPADLYVLWDDRAGPAPRWLEQDFTDTGMKIGIDEGPYRDTRTGKFYAQTARTPGKMAPLKVATGPGKDVDVVYSIWHREVANPGPIKLGATLGRKYTHGSMYGIAAVAKKTNAEQ